MISNKKASIMISSTADANRIYSNIHYSSNTVGKNRSARKSNRGFAGLVTLTIILIMLLMFSGIQSADAFKPAEYQSLTVVSGDSIWSIASDLNQNHYDGKQDVRQLVYSICEANELESPVIHPGQTLQIPLP